MGEQSRLFTWPNVNVLRIMSLDFSTMKLRGSLDRFKNAPNSKKTKKFARFFVTFTR
jgi:hypothetical protein